MAHRRHKAGWSELYPEILTSIAGRLQTHDDFRHFRSVCSNWRSYTHQIPNNLPALSPIFPRHFPHRPPTLVPIGLFGYPLDIVANTTVLIQNPNPNFPKPWLFTVEEWNPGKLILRKPLVRNLVEEEDFPRFLDLSRFRVRKIRKDYNFRRVDGDFLPINYKVLLFYDYGCGDPTSVDDCYVIVLDGERKLSFARLKKKYDYGYLEYSGVKLFDDIVCYKGAVWTIDKKGRVYVIRYDSKDLRLRRFASNGVYDVHSRYSRKRLIESDDGLYLIYRDVPYSEGKFIVFKLNEGERKWCEVKDLDGKILFVSSDCCFFAPVEDFPGYAGNCILFPKDHFLSVLYYRDDQYFEGTDKVLEIGVFHLDDGKSGLITTNPRYSEIFWPPPCWLFSDTFPSTSLLRDDEETESEIPTLHTPCASNSVQIGEQAKETEEELKNVCFNLSGEDGFIDVQSELKGKHWER